MTDTIEITPLSEFTGDARAFLGLLSYHGSARVTPEMQRLWQGDHHLFGLLDDEIRRRPHVSVIADLPEDVIRECVNQVEALHYGEWRLDGDESRPILERLDEHFRPMQEQHAQRRREQTEMQARHAQESAKLSRDVAERADADYRRLWNLPT